MTKCSSQFVSSTREEIKKVQQASCNKNTDKYSQEIIELDNNTLSDQLKQFLVEVHRSNVVNIFDKHQFRSLHCTLDGYMKSIIEKENKNCKQSDPLETEEIKFLLDSPVITINTPKGFLRRVWIWLSLLCCLRGGDAKRLKASWIKELDNGGMQLELPKEKNHARNAYIPVTDIKRYLLRCSNNVEDDYFFVSINVLKKVYHGEWYLLTKLGKCSYDAMMHSICEKAKLDFKSHNITNHSMRSMGVSAYQLQSIKRKIDNVSYLIPTEETGFSKMSDLLSTMLNKKTKTSEDRELDDQKPTAGPKCKNLKKVLYQTKTPSLKHKN
ncbi:14398_t:CDS:2 [Cetraspora pellucida]|uniref:14398_t:CDS:1 n=1 Tax=Cetraspora pellucida TaxID=1433469 RepID=A0A9N9J4Y9_9GLOM|nr:14398_t:CDS:2 [Cetraspora pellucida]